jgi:hypothetical protein
MTASAHPLVAGHRSIPELRLEPGSRFIGIALAALLFGCGGPPPPISLDAAWPTKVRRYETATRAWTRHGDLRADLSQDKERILDVYATFKSPEWRLAYIAFLKRNHRLPDAAAAKLIEEHRTASQNAYEVQLLVSTYDRRANDLQKNAKSTWRVALVDDAGNEVRPAYIKRDRRPRTEILAEYPFFTDFHTAYVATFPRSIELLRDDASRFSLRMGSSRGGVELVWKSAAD